MSETDVTKIKNHIFWIYGIIFFCILGFSGIITKVYLNQQSKNEAFTEKLASKDLYIQKEISQIQVDVAVIKMQITQLYKSIEEEFERQRKERELEKMKAIHNKKGEEEQ